MLLSEMRREDPTVLEVFVFSKLSATLLPLQKQLDQSYHTDTFLRYWLLTATDISSIESTLRDRA